MSESGQIALDVRLKIDRICDSFEEEWQRDQPPDISSHLPGLALEHRLLLLEELIKLDLHYRRIHGMTPRREYYYLLFPDSSDFLARMEEGFAPAEIGVEKPFQEVGDYRLISELGRGSFGRVWRAWDVRMTRMIALKVPTSLTQTVQTAQMFQREARAAAQLDHPGIVQVYGWGVEEQRAYIAMQLIEGESLLDRVRRKPLTFRQAAALAAQVADALQHAHEQKVIHRDLKPGNILLNLKGEPLIADFGLARRIDIASTLGKPNGMVGTLAYMSPEQVGGRGGVDGGSDVYGLGAILYELLTGRPLFDGDVVQVIQQILDTPPPPPRSINPEIPEELETLCLKALEKKPRQRFKDAGEFRDELQRFLHAAPILTRPVTRLQRLGRRLAARPLWIGLGILLVLLAFLVIFPPDGLRDNASQAASIPDLSFPTSVLIETRPAGARVMVRKLDPDTGDPQRPEELPVQPANQTPVVHDLKPGLYQLTAMFPEQNRFIEVFRTMPAAGDSMLPEPYHYQFWQNDGAGHIRWDAIPVPDNFVEAGMIYVPTGHAVELGDPDLPFAPVHRRDILAFYISRDEYRVGDFIVDNHGQKLVNPRQPDPKAPCFCRFDQAMAWSERAGARLPTEAELEYLAQLVAAAGNNDTDTLTRLTRLQGEELNTLRKNLAEIEAVFGGQAEWVWGRPNAYAIHAGQPTNPEWQPAEFQVLRGGGTEAAGQNPRLARQIRPYFVSEPEYGFRLARTANGPPAGK